MGSSSKATETTNTSDKERRRAEREARKEELEDRRRNSRPRGVPACVFAEDLDEDEPIEASPDPSALAGRGQRIVRVSMMRPKHPKARKQRVFSIGSMKPGPL